MSTFSVATPAVRDAFPRFNSVSQIDTKVVETLMEALVRKRLEPLVDRFAGDVDPKVVWRFVQERPVGRLTWRCLSEGKPLCVAVSLAHEAGGFSSDRPKIIHAVCEAFVSGDRKMERINEVDFDLDEWLSCQILECAEVALFFARR